MPEQNDWGHEDGWRRKVQLKDKIILLIFQ